MPVFAVIVPELTILPTTLETPERVGWLTSPNSMPICGALIEPLLLTPPRKVLYAADDDASLCAKGSPFATIKLALMMAPAMGISLDDDALRRRYRAAVDRRCRRRGAAEHRGTAALADLDAGPRDRRDLAAVADAAGKRPIPVRCAAIPLLLATTPLKIVPLARRMPRSEAVIVPLLVMPPDALPPKTAKKL